MSFFHCRLSILATLPVAPFSSGTAVHVLSDILAVWRVEIDCPQVARNSSLVLCAKPTFRFAAEGLGLSGLAGTLAARRNGYVGLEVQT